MNRYSAQKQYWKAKQTKQDKEKIADVVLLQKLQVCARAGVCALSQAACLSELWTAPQLPASPSAGHRSAVNGLCSCTWSYQGLLETVAPANLI